MLSACYSSVIFCCRVEIKGADFAEELRKDLESFTLDNSRSEMEFPSFFNSHQRLQVHEVRPGFIKMMSYT